MSTIPSLEVTASAEDSRSFIPDQARLTESGEGLQSDELGSAAVPPDYGYVDSARERELWLYRERTVSLLHRYFRLSLEVGRLPSILGRELFRSKVTSYRMSSFEDAVIFVHDVENALEQLDSLSKKLIALILFEDYSQDEAADILRCARRTVCRQFPEALDQMSELFLEGGLLNRLPGVAVENSCQEGEKAEFPATDWKQVE